MSGQSLTARLVAHPLAAVRGTYAAPSYAWGPTDDPVQITLDGRSFAVTRNLGGALRSLRAAGEGRGADGPPAGFWVDALCINQADPRERGAQVRRMRDIYAGAFYTAVWLGPADEMAFRVVDVVQRMSVLNKLMETIDRKSYGKGSDSYGLPPPGSSVWLMLRGLLEAPYFSRIWPIQEVIMSSNLVGSLGTGCFPLGATVRSHTFLGHDWIGFGFRCINVS